jgi:DNA-directed RNA polymerase specialized sigma24 family protein
MLDSGLDSPGSQPTQSPDRSRILVDDLPSPKPKWVLTAESFDAMLVWLNPDRNEAAKKYEEIRAALIKRFQQLIKRFPQLSDVDAETLATKTFDRVAKKLPEVIATYVGPPEPYFFSIALYVFKEHLRKPVLLSLATADYDYKELLSAEEKLEKELLDACLQHCMDQLSPTNRAMIREYYYGDGPDKIKIRKELAERLGIRLSNLRLKAQRVRATLKQCILECMERKGQEHETIM